MRILRRREAGDTIVEVLIAMAVASAVIGSSYVVVNRTMANSQQAQEHSAALELANEQLERIVRLAASDPTGGVFNSSPTYQCVSKVDASLVGQHLLSTTTLDDESKYNPSCIRTESPARYRTAFTYNSGTDIFTVSVRWSSATANGNDQLSLMYKAHR